MAATTPEDEKTIPVGAGPQGPLLQNRASSLRWWCFSRQTWIPAFAGMTGAGEFDIPAKAGIHVSFTHTVCLSAFSR